MINNTKTKNWTALAEDTGLYFLKALTAILLSILAVALTIIAWVSSSLSLGFGILCESCFKGARILNTRLTKIRWYKIQEAK